VVPLAKGIGFRVAAAVLDARTSTCPCCRTAAGLHVTPTVVFEKTNCHGWTSIAGVAVPHIEVAGARGLMAVWRISPLI
jgi:hypothetical protein